ncbi:MAG TPA: hypothetical protein DER60_07915 [Syntrophomonas sp.]|jgi:hypothetical protein|nr:hypothetical protein [Syntrophomonas sp.]
MRDLTAKETLSIVVCHEDGESARQLAEYASRGIEEEHMPVLLLPVATGNSIELARLACETSLLAVGVGIDQQGSISLTHFQMPADKPVLHAPSGSDTRKARLMGGNAARLYKRIPFIFE